MVSLDIMIMIMIIILYSYSKYTIEYNKSNNHNTKSIHNFQFTHTFSNKKFNSTEENIENLDIL